MENPKATGSLRSRLIKAALDCFLADDYHNVTTRHIAECAGANVSMIRYYFGSKEGLYEEMIRETLSPLLDVLDGPLLDSTAGFAEFLSLYYRTMSARPEFPKLLLKVLALRHSPGRRFIQQLLERGRTRGARKVANLKAQGQIAAAIPTSCVWPSSVWHDPNASQRHLRRSDGPPHGQRIPGKSRQLQWASVFRRSGAGRPQLQRREA